MMKRALLLAMLAASLLAGCVGMASCDVAGGPDAGSGLPGLTRQNAIIDWVNSIRFGGITYLATDAGRELQPGDLGAQFATVRFQLADHVTDPNYHMRDGDAAFLAGGTPIYRVNGYAATFRLAAHDTQNGNGIILYEADTNPHAKSGADLLDIGGRVRAITVMDDSGTAERAVATISDPYQVARLVALLLGSPVDQNHVTGDGPRYFLSFALSDSTQVVRAYFPEGHEVARGIIVPSAFVSTLAALGA